MLPLPFFNLFLENSLAWRFCSERAKTEKIQIFRKERHGKIVTADLWTSYSLEPDASETFSLVLDFSSEVISSDMSWKEIKLNSCSFLDPNSIESWQSDSQWKLDQYLKEEDVVDSEQRKRLNFLKTEKRRKNGETLVKKLEQRALLESLRGDLRKKDWLKRKTLLAWVQFRKDELGKKLLQKLCWVDIWIAVFLKEDGGAYLHSHLNFFLDCPL